MKGSPSRVRVSKRYGEIWRNFVTQNWAMFCYSKDKIQKSYFGTHSTQG